MLLRIKLKNGKQIEKRLSPEQIKKIEQSKEFKILNKKAKKISCNFNYWGNCNYCYKSKVECQKRLDDRLKNFSNYINVLQSI